MLLFSVLGVKEGIAGEITTDNITTEIRKQEKECKDAFNIKKPTVGNVEATQLVLIAAGLIQYVFKNEEEEENERVVMQLATAEYKYLIQNNDAWNQIPSCYFREERNA